MLPQTRTAEYPFNEQSELADIVIRSVDLVDFFVFKALLCIGSKSSFFGHLLADSQPTAETRNGLSVLSLPEPGAVLRTALLFCYPLDAPVLEDIKEIALVGETLNKYCLDMAVARLQRSVATSALIKAEPLRVFALAVHYGWKVLGRAAAKHTLATPIDTLVPIPELAMISALDLAHLMEYHRECARATQTLAERRDYALGMAMFWLNGRAAANELLFRQTAWCKWCKGRLSYRIAFGDGHGQGDVHSWATTFVEQAMVQLRRRPCPDAILDETLLGNTIIQSITDCNSDGWKSIAYTQIHCFARLLAEEVDRLISQVCPPSCLYTLLIVSQVELKIVWPSETS